MGEQIHAVWTLAHNNLQDAIVQTAPRLKSIAAQTASTLGAGTGGVLMFVISWSLPVVSWPYADVSASTAPPLRPAWVGSIPGRLGAHVRCDRA